MRVIKARRRACIKKIIKHHTTHLTITVQALLHRRHIRRRHNTLDISARKVLRAIGKIRQVHVVGQVQRLGQRPENGQPCRPVGQRALDQPVDAARSQQCAVQQFGSRCGRNHDDALETLDAVEFGEQLVDDAIGDAGRVVAASLHNQMH